VEEPALEFVFEARVEVAAPVSAGRTHAGGERRLVPIVGGTVSGPRAAGRVLPGGADWQVAGDDGVVRLVARYALELEDGTIVAVTNAGLARARDDGSRYFRTHATFEVRDGPHGWLARSVFVSTARVEPPVVVLRFFEVQ
jgi:hypothetical protein